MPLSQKEVVVAATSRCIGLIAVKRLRHSLTYDVSLVILPNIHSASDEPNVEEPLSEQVIPTMESTDRRSLVPFFIMAILSHKHMLLHLNFSPGRLYLDWTH